MFDHKVKVSTRRRAVATQLGTCRQVGRNLLDDEALPRRTSHRVVLQVGQHRPAESKVRPRTG